MSQAAKHITFSGRVQGVGFRFTALRMADRCKLTGQVRNLPNGTVEMVVQGNADDIDNCLREIEQSFRGYISHTKITAVPVNPKYDDFKITF